LDGVPDEGQKDCGKVRDDEKQLQFKVGPDLLEGMDGEESGSVAEGFPEGALAFNQRCSGEVKAEKDERQREDGGEGVCKCGERWEFSQDAQQG